MVKRGTSQRTNDQHLTQNQKQQLTRMNADLYMNAEFQEMDWWHGRPRLYQGWHKATAEGGCATSKHRD